MIININEMKKIFFLICLIFVIGSIQGQRSGILIVDLMEYFDYIEFNKQPLGFEEKLELLGMKYLPNRQFTFSEHALDYYLGTPCCDNSPCPLESILLVYGAKFVHEDKQCEIFISNISAFEIRDYGTVATISEKGPSHGSYNKIFGYDLTDTNTEELIEKVELKYNLHYYPQDSARMIFNADYMFEYKEDMKEKVHGNDFTHTIAVVTGRRGLDIIAYFVLTDESVKNFDKYLSDFRHTLWFSEE